MPSVRDLIGSFEIWVDEFITTTASGLRWVKERAAKRNIPIVEAPNGRHSSRAGDLRPKVAGTPHTLFHRKRARRGGLPTPNVLLPGRILRQPRLPPSLGPGQLGERLLDANRTIGQPKKITVIFGRKITKHYRGKLQTEIEDMNLPNPVIRSHFGNGFIKQHLRDHLILRTESASNNVNDYGVNKAVENLISSARPYRRSTTTISTCSRIFWRPLSIVASYESLRNRRSRLPESAIRASSSITLGNSP
jgi:hypothetical protein